MKIMHIVGARPNFMKTAPIYKEMKRLPEAFKQMIVHTGQHYDQNMSRVFFEELGLPDPEVNLEVGSASHAVQTAEIMRRIEPVLIEWRPDWLFVVGDVNSTMACSLVAAKLGIKIAHVEAGLRSFDRSMPEEINRVITDSISSLLFTPSRDADENLKREGVSPDNIRFVGNIMIDSLVTALPHIDKAWLTLKKKYRERYILVTLHRPSNVDDPRVLAEIVKALNSVSDRIKVVFPVHPRTRKLIGSLVISPKIDVCEPMGYNEFLAMEKNAVMVITDSGGIQEETCYFGVSCITLRPNTERPITISAGTNQLVESKSASIIEAADKLLNKPASRIFMPDLWDGHTAERIAGMMMQCNG